MNLPHGGPILFFPSTVGKERLLQLFGKGVVCLTEAILSQFHSILPRVFLFAGSDIRCNLLELFVPMASNKQWNCYYNLIFPHLGTHERQIRLWLWTLLLKVDFRFLFSSRTGHLSLLNNSMTTKLNLLTLREGLQSVLSPVQVQFDWERPLQRTIDTRMSCKYNFFLQETAFLARWRSYTGVKFGTKSSYPRGVILLSPLWHENRVKNGPKMGEGSLEKSFEQVQVCQGTEVRF